MGEYDECVESHVRKELGGAGVCCEEREGLSEARCDLGVEWKFGAEVVTGGELERVESLEMGEGELNKTGE